MKAILLLLGFSFSICYSFAAPTVSSFTPTSASTGTTVTINGSGFVSVTSVTFGGTAATSFIVVSPTQITAVVATGASGSVLVTLSDLSSGSKTGFVYISTPAIITDFGGFWSTNVVTPNSTVPDSSHNLLAFTYNGVTYSTGANDAILTSHSVTFSSGSYHAMPVAGITGNTSTGGSFFIALADKVDGSVTVANTPAVSNYTVKTVLTDGANGLDLGTGITNLPTSAVMTFQIFNIDPTKISDNEPDIILTQIASPSAGNDVFGFVDNLGNTVGNTVSQDMTLLSKFGTYNLDLFNLTPNTPYNSATVYSSNAANTNRDIRVVAFRLADFGITTGNVSQVKALKITPSGNSDYAFIAYNANAINLPPNVNRDDGITNEMICSGGTSNLAVDATGTVGGTLTYSWEESTDGGSSWHSVNNGGSYSGATTNRLSIVNATNGYQYRATVQESGNANSSTSSVFTIVIGSPAPPSSVSISSSSTTPCLNTPVQLSSTVVGGSNLNYQWQTNASSTYQDIPNANLSTYVPPVNQTGAISYQLFVSSGSGCATSVQSASAVTITVAGISSTTPSSVCNSGSMTLNATATSGNIDWYSVDAGGSSLATNTSFTTPVLSSTTTYYVSASGCASALRVPVVATVYPLSVGGSVGGSTTVVSGSNSTTLTLSGQTGSVTKWQSSTDNFGSVITDIPNTTTSLTATNLTQTTEYRAVIQSGSCASTNSGFATLTVTGTLPIDNATLRASKVTDGILLEWQAYNLNNTIQFEVERSADGVSFSNIATVAIVNISQQNYSLIDRQPLQGNNFYRIKEVLRSGGFTYSAVVKLTIGNGQNGISIYPNPVTDHSTSVELNQQPAGNYQLRFVNNNGQLIYQTNIVHSGGSSAQSIILPAKITRGVYYVQIVSPLNKTSSLKLIVF